MSGERQRPVMVPIIESQALRQAGFRHSYAAACGLIYLFVMGASLRGFAVPWVMWGSILFLSMPITWLTASIWAAKREHNLSILNYEGRFRGFFTGTTLRVLLAWVGGLAIGLALFAKLTILSGIDAGLFLLAAFFLKILFNFYTRLFEGEVVARHHGRLALTYASWTTVPILGLLKIVLVVIAPGLLDPLVSFAVIGKLTHWHVPDAELSAGFLFISEYARAWGSANAWLSAWAGEGSPFLEVILTLIFELFSYAGVVSLFAFFLMSQRDLKRAVLPADVTAGSRPLRAGEIAWPVSLSVILIGFIYFPTAAKFEGYASTEAARRTQELIFAQLPVDRPSPPRLPVDTKSSGTKYDSIGIPIMEEPNTPGLVEHRDAEKIGDKFYDVGTAQKLIEAGEAVARLEADARAEAKYVVKQSFHAARLEGVPAFLDWYYSLTGEYARALSLLSGSGEAYLSEKLETILAQTEGLTDKITVVTDRYDPELKEARDRYTRILQENRLTLAPTERVKEVAIYDGNIIPVPDFEASFGTSLKQRIGGTGAGAAASSLIAATVARKVAAKGVFKVAATALVKAAGSKAIGGGGGATGGAMAGGALGSFFPGAGTIVGAVIGGIVGGVAGGVAIDYMVLEVEEHFRREAFEAEILQAIQEVETQTLSALGL